MGTLARMHGPSNLVQLAARNFRHIVDHVLDHLGGPEMPLLLMKLILSSADEGMRTYAEATGDHASIGGGSGNDWCCRGTKVDVLAPEAFAIAEDLKVTLDGPRLDTIVSKLRVAVSA